MVIPLHVRAYSDLRANERPIRFTVDEETREIGAIEDRPYPGGT